MVAPTCATMDSFLIEHCGTQQRAWELRELQSAGNACNVPCGPQSTVSHMPFQTRNLQKALKTWEKMQCPASAVHCTGQERTEPLPPMISGDFVDVDMCISWLSSTFFLWSQG